MDTQLVKTDVKVKEETLNGCQVIKIKPENEEKPKTMEKVVSDEKEASTLKPVQEKTEEFAETSLHECCYCGEKRSLKDMTPTPEHHEEFLKWYRILGEKFYENARSSKSAMVCRSHFIDEFGDSRLIDVVRMNNVAETRIGQTHKCSYCGKARMKKSLTIVPKNERMFDEWVKILGEGFVENCRKNKDNFICRSHFDVKWPKFRPNGFLPVADSKENPENKKHGTSSDGSNNVQTKITQKMYFCISCEEQKRYPELTKVPQDPYILKLWGQILGENFYKRAILRTESFICRSHFDGKWNCNRPPDLLPISGSGIAKAVSSKEHFDENTVETTTAKYVKDQFMCVFCEKWKTLGELKFVPRDSSTLQRWAKKFGSAFSIRVQSKRRAFICRSHFDDEEDCSKSHGHETSQLIKEIQKEKDEYSSSSRSKPPLIEVKIEGPCFNEKLDKELLKCCYCENQKTIEKMALVPRNKIGLTRWMNILGVEFYQNVMKNKHSYICRTHFNEQWYSEKIPDKVPVRNVEKIMKEQEKPLHLLRYDIKSENKNQETDTEDFLEMNLECHQLFEIPTMIEEENVTIQIGPSDPKIIKIEVKEEPIY